METSIELFPAEIQRMGQKKFCIQPRIFNLMILQIIRRPIKEL
jgi:hypothetical protein